ncbi:MAG: glycosyltransferase [Acidobacteria bacterium]|nr:glycosyltransferase [Acidobacteriota bacterium]
MVGESLLGEEVQQQIRDIGRVDILIGIPSYNNARTIGHVVRAINAGFAKYFPEQRTILVNSDGGSTDGTPDMVRQTAIDDYCALLTAHPLHTVHKIITPYHGIPGKGSALRTVFKIAAELEAKACAVVDADLRSITPEWVDLLISPVLREGFDFVAPVYRRHKYDGTITNSIVYPLTRALYGKRVRQPIGGDFGFSGRLAQHYLSHDVWHTDVARFGIDTWMTTTAITGGFKICQSFLGAKIHDVKDPGVDLSAMLTQVVSSVFSLMETYHEYWARINNSTSVPLFGFEYTVGLEPIRVNVDRMIHSFQTALRELASIWERVLSRETFEKIRRLGSADRKAFRFPANLWVRTVYDFAVAYYKIVINREHLLKSLTPLYLGRTASFVLETSEASAEEVEQILEGLGLEYEHLKPYLIQRWDS